MLMYRKCCLYIFRIYLTKYYVLLFFLETLVFCHLWSHVNNDLSSISIILMRSREIEKNEQVSLPLYTCATCLKAVCADCVFKYTTRLQQTSGTHFPRLLHVKDDLLHIIRSGSWSHVVSQYFLNFACGNLSFYGSLNQGDSGQFSANMLKN